MRHSTLLRAVTAVAFALCFGVVVLGAYVRLNNAGLGCPDWPGCYGHFTPAGAAADPATNAAPLAGRPLDLGKAWREMAHRYAAGTVGTLIVIIAAMALVWRRERLVGLALPLALLSVVVLQGVLGMLTVTWQLTPLIVTMHLLFGFLTLSLLWWLLLSQWQGTGHARLSGPVRAARALAALGLAALALQIALGGWTSSNYAAIACPDLPTCRASWWPAADFRSAFALWRGLGIDYEGGVLADPARIAIHLTHRLGALLASVTLLLAALAGSRIHGGAVRAGAAAVTVALALQLSIGMSMVLRGFPLALATAHNAGAALLLLATLALIRSLRSDAVTGDG